MKNLASMLPRMLFGLLTFYGGVLHFTVDVAIWKNDFLTSLYETGYLWQLIGVINLLAGLCLVVNRYTLLALIVMLPITLNILLYHFFYLTPDGLFIGIPMFALNGWCIWQYRYYFQSLLQFKLSK
jgi:putative oxidoreductase